MDVKDKIKVRVEYEPGYVYCPYAPCKIPLIPRWWWVFFPLRWKALWKDVLARRKSGVLCFDDPPFAISDKIQAEMEVCSIWKQGEEDFNKQLEASVKRLPTLGVPIKDTLDLPESQLEESESRR